LESFVAETLEFGLRQKPRISGPERLLRLGAYWHERTGRSSGPGVILQFDRYVRDCQACGVKPSRKSEDHFDWLVTHYESELKRDGLLDRMSAVTALVEEIQEASGASHGPGVLNFLQRFEAILVDGFHRLEPVELDLIAALGKACDVYLWLVGVPGTSSWKTVEDATKLLELKCGQKLRVDRGFEDLAPATSFSQVGRRLFQNEEKPLLGRWASVGTSTGLSKLEVNGPLEEVETVAKQIKSDYLESHKLRPLGDPSQPGSPLRLSDVAVIIPGPDYDPLIREVFPRAGLEFNLAGRALLVSTSRPARVLLAAINLIQGQWRYDLLRDFLNQPLVIQELHRRLQSFPRLDDLFEHRPRARQQMSHELWSDFWKRQLERLKKNIEAWRSGRLDLPERTTLTQKEFVATQEEMAASLERLIASIEGILKVVESIEQAFENPPKERPLADLVRAMLELLGDLKIDEWLTPPSGREGPVLWVEYEKDQNAYLKLLDILESLKDIPADRLPKRPGDPGGVSLRVPDVLSALELSLDGETYQIKTEDDAGVQVFELREIRGLRFRHVYVLGLVNGQIPALPEEGTLVRRRLDIELLKLHLNQKEAEVQFLFSQVFEAAQDKLILSRFRLDGDRPALPSPFLTEVEDCLGISIAELKPCRMVCGIGQAAGELGQIMRASRVAIATPASEEPGFVTRTISKLWPDISAETVGALEPIINGLNAWQQRPAINNLSVNWPEILEVLYPDDYEFSASQLELFARCPFRFFGSRVLHLEERETDPTRIEYGSLVHRVLQRFYRQKRETTHVSVDQPLPAVSASDRKLFIELFEMETSQLDQGILPPDLKSLFVKAGGVIDLLIEVLEIIEKKESEFGNLSTEYVLDKVLLGKDAGGRSVLLSGKIDRVDSNRNDSQTRIIIDYKTGGNPGSKAVTTKVKDGRMMQLLLYAAALQIKESGVSIVGGAYTFLNEKARSKTISAEEALVAIGKPIPNNLEAELWNAQAALQLALGFANQIRSGKFPLTHYGSGSDLAECTAYCPLRHACRHPEGYASKGF
jgi:ATP-dependent helicase/DNAse subunit B